MGVGRLIVIGLVVWMGLRWWRSRRAAASDAPDTRHGGRMVACETCGVFVPETEASRTTRNAWRCSQHRHVGAG